MSDFRNEIVIKISEHKEIRIASTTENIDPLIVKAIELAERVKTGNYKPKTD